MAKIENLIDQIQNESLRKAIAGEVKILKKTKKFGLVFKEPSVLENFRERAGGVENRTE